MSPPPPELPRYHHRTRDRRGASPPRARRGSGRSDSRCCSYHLHIVVPHCERSVLPVPSSRRRHSTHRRWFTQQLPTLVAPCIDPRDRACLCDAVATKRHSSARRLTRWPSDCGASAASTSGFMECPYHVTERDGGRHRHRRLRGRRRPPQPGIHAEGPEGCGSNRRPKPQHVGRQTGRPSVASYQPYGE